MRRLSVEVAVGRESWLEAEAGRRCWVLHSFHSRCACLTSPAMCTDCPISSQLAPAKPLIAIIKSWVDSGKLDVEDLKEIKAKGDDSEEEDEEDDAGGEQALEEIPAPRGRRVGDPR